MIKNQVVHILHIEDDNAIRVSVHYVLSDAGYQVHAVANGREALDFLATHSNLIDIIFSDVMMPVMDGFTFCTEQLKDRSISDIPTIIYSADARNKLTAEARGLPFISKPFNLIDLFEGIAKYVRK